MARKEKSSKEKKKISEKKEVCEIFEVEKNGKETEIKSCGIETEKPASPEQIKKEKKIFFNIMAVMIGLVLFFLVFYFMSYYTTHFEYQGVKFEVVKMGQLTFYKTSLPVNYQNSKADYNFYLRNDPRRLGNVEFDGEINLKQNMVFEMTDSFNCNGDGVISIANLQNLYNLVGTKMIRDENATCDIQGRYMFLQINEGNETKITEYGLNGGCYNIEVNNCEILPATEKFMLETFIDVNAKLKNQ